MKIVVLLSIALSSSLTNDVIAAVTMSPTGSTSSTVNQSSSAYYRLKQDLLEREAVKGLIPPGDGLLPLVVNVSINPFGVLDVDDAKQVSTRGTSSLKY
jgi:hypothetical protein